jgi:hypothetical protein
MTLQSPARVAGRDAFASGDVKDVEDLTEDVELELLDRAIADAYRP